MGYVTPFLIFHPVRPRAATTCVCALPLGYVITLTRHDSLTR
jgi:hypothetical protein